MKMLKVLAVLCTLVSAASVKNATVKEEATSAHPKLKFLSSPGKVTPVTVVGKSKAAAAAADMSASSMEAAITDMMLGKSVLNSAFAATPMGGSVNQIKRIITNSMMPKVKNAHKADQKSLKQLNDAIKRCGSEKQKGLRKAAPLNTLYYRNSRYHKSCRRVEASAYQSKRSCYAQRRSLYQQKKLKCRIYSNAIKAYGTQTANTRAVRKAGSERVDTYIRRISGTFCGSHVHGSRGQYSRKGGLGGGLPNSILDKYLKAKGGCSKATRLYNLKVNECKRKTRAYNVRKSRCNSYQDLMDGNSCKASVLTKDACETYAGCYRSAVKQYRAEETRVFFQARDRKAEWRGLNRMQCLIVAFGDGKVKDKEIDECKKKTVDTRYFNLRRLPVPPLRRCVIPSLYPTTSKYLRREFVPLPAYAKGKRSAECSGIQDISTRPARGSPRSCKCTRLTLNGPYSAGGIVKCTNCWNVNRATQKNSCPAGTKIFSPASRSDWRTFIRSAGRLAAPHWIVDVTRPQNGCGGCQRNPMNSRNRKQVSWKTSDGSPWWLRSRPYGEPNGNYVANCFLTVRAARNENTITLDDWSCNYHSKSYYCQTARANLQPARGSPKSCKCTAVTLSGRFSPGKLVRCEHCLDVRRSTQKNSCPNGMKLWSPRSRSDWTTVLNSAGPLALPHFIIDITRPQNGCGGCRSAMKKSNHRQASWRTSDGSAWWLRNSGYGEPNGDYHANCFLGLWTHMPSENNVRFNDHNCNYHSRSYYCQPRQSKTRRKPEIKVPPERTLVKTGLVYGLKEEVYYWKGQLKRVPRMGYPINVFRDRAINQRSTKGKWQRLKKKDRFAIRWSGIIRIRRAGRYHFQLRSDDGSKLYINNRLSVNNDGLHGMRSRNSRAMNLVRGQHWIRVEAFENGGKSGCQLRFHGPDSGNRWRIVPAGSLMSPVIKGFKEEIFYNIKKMKRLPSVSKRIPSITRFVGNVNYPPRGAKWPGYSGKDNFVVKWTGQLKCHRAGLYKWAITSDDGSKFWMKNRYTRNRWRLIINNDGLHGWRTKERSFHAGSMNYVSLQFFERGGGAGMLFRYMGPDTRNRMVVVPKNKMIAI